MTKQDDLERTQKALMRLAAVPDPNPLRRASARRAFLEGASRLQAGSAAVRPVRRWFRLVAAIASALGLALAGVTGVAYAADRARPGDLLYPLDREMEKVQLMLAPDPQHKADLLLAIADERLQEAESLASQGDQQHMDAALQSYSQTVSIAAQTVDSDKGVGQPALISRLDETLSVHEQRLESIRRHVPAPDQPEIDRAVAAAHRGRRPHPTPEPTSDSPTIEQTPQPHGHPTHEPHKTPEPPQDHPGHPTPEGHDRPRPHHGDPDGGHH